MSLFSRKKNKKKSSSSTNHANSSNVIKRRIIQPAAPIFYDPNRKRWRKFLAIVSITAELIFMLLGSIISMMVLQEKISSGDFQNGTSDPRQISGKSSDNSTPSPDGTVKNIFEAPSYLSSPSQNHRPLAIAYFVNWDPNSYTSLKKNIGSIDILIPEWIHIGSDYSISMDNQKYQEEITKYVKDNGSNVKIMPLINNFNIETLDWDQQLLSEVITNPVQRTTTVLALLKYVKDNGYAGVTVDFESIPAGEYPQLVSFMQELYVSFKSENLLVAQTAPFDDANFDYKNLPQYSDYVLIMSYDEHWSTSDPGPISSQRWFAENVIKRALDIPREKLIYTVGNYGYDWKEGDPIAQEISFWKITEYIRNYNFKLEFDSSSLNPYMYYQDSEGVNHTVWFLDGVTLFNQLSFLHNMSLPGIAIWRLGSEDPTMWNVMDAFPDISENTAKSLEIINYGGGIQYSGSGEILKMISEPSEGKRSIYYDAKLRAITSESVPEAPASYLVNKIGNNNSTQLALTFDDGPDPKYTPQILDILKKYNIKATFFIIGEKGVVQMDLLNRIYQEGHEIGVHSFTHPDISDISSSQLKTEINFTQRLIESVTGHSTILFRPPYGEYTEPDNPQDAKSLILSGQMGYYTVDSRVDAKDWSNPGVDKIINNTIAQVESGEGNIILFHDGGGDRGQTVAALESVIQQLQAKGYTFIPVSEELSSDRQTVMPAVSQTQIAEFSVLKLGIQLGSILKKSMSYLLAFVLVAGLIRMLVWVCLATIQKLKTRKQKFGEFYPRVSVIVPAWNEEKVIVATITSLLESDYPHFNVIVVDDGSKDGTFRKVCKAFPRNPKVQVYRKSNGGKASAINYGVARSRASIIVVQDADTLFRHDTIRNLVRHFSDENVGAVAGNAKVGNRLNLLTQFQALEYITSQNLDRRALGLLNGITVVPGAVGAWRRKLIIKGGGFKCDTLAEDAELTVRILKMGYKVVYDDQAIAYTESPDTFRGFIKQRFRWMFGTMQSCWKHKDAAFNPKYKGLGMVSLPNVLFFQILFPLISPIVDVIAILGAVDYITNAHKVAASGGWQNNIFVYYIGYLIFDFILAAIAFILEKKENYRLILLLPLQRLVFRFIIYIVALRTFFVAIKGPLVGWGKLERKMTAKQLDLKGNYAVK